MTDSELTKQKTIDFFNNIITSLENNTISIDNALFLGNFEMEYKFKQLYNFQKEENKIQNYLILGWFITQEIEARRKHAVTPTFDIHKNER